MGYYRKKFYRKSNRYRKPWYTGYEYMTHDGFSRFLERNNGRYDWYTFDGKIQGTGLNLNEVLDFLYIENPSRNNISRSSFRDSMRY